MVCNYAGTPHWLPGQVMSILGPVFYQVSLIDGRSWRRHQDQLLKATHTFDTRSEIDTDFGFYSSDDETSDSPTTTPQVVDNQATEQLPCCQSSRVRHPPYKLRIDYLLTFVVFLEGRNVVVTKLHNCNYTHR